MREDEEQNVKLSESIDLLLAAGYFRARIKGLSPFDKVSPLSHEILSLSPIEERLHAKPTNNHLHLYVDCGRYDLVYSNV